VSSLSVRTAEYLEDASGLRGNAEKAFAPATTAEVRQIVAAAVESKTPLTIVGARTGLTGASVPEGGWIMSMSRFRSLDIQNGRARCGVGLSLQDLENEAAKTGQFLGPNPTEYSASVGGMVSTNAGGARSFGFRSLRYQALGMEVTFMNGETTWVRRGDLLPFPFTPVRQPATRKNSAGYYLEPDTDWPNLLAGSEGTLGIITDIDLQLRPIAPAILSGVVFFPVDEDSLDAVDAWRSVPHLRLLEYLDDNSLNFLRSRHPEVPANAVAALLVEQDLNSEHDEEVDQWLDRLARHNALADESWFGFSFAERERFRMLRHSLAAAVVERFRHSGLPKLGSDFAVPVPRNRELLKYYRERCAERFQGRYMLYGHIGDANVHLNVFPDTPEEGHVGEALLTDCAKFALSLGGTIAAEHGIGKRKRDLFRLMYSPAEIEAMRAVKRHLDPNWLLGRGTIFESPQ
jgi:FAD/FMN-containing dehydrogenase